MATSLFPAAATALAAGLALQPLVLRVLTAKLVLDLPSARSAHAVPVPRGGGLAVVLAAGAGLAMYRPAWPLLVPLLLFAGIGLWEDLRGVPVPARLLLQAGAGAAGALLLVPAALPVPVRLALMVAVLCWLMAYANAFNFMDGVNGISGMHAVLAGTVYLGLGAWHGLPALAVGGAVIAVAALTFLPWNAGKARMFLGDVGSYGLGAGLGALAAYGLLHGAPPAAVLAPLALYLADTGWTLARRCYRGAPWHRPHREHAYQRLTDLGWSHQQVTAVTALVSAAVCAAALGAVSSGPLLRLALLAAAGAVLTAYLAAPAVLRAPALPATWTEGSVRA